MDKALLTPALLRLTLITAVSFIFAFAFNEATYAMQKEPTDRAPTTFTVVVPDGTAARLEAGEQMNLLPEEITFVLGDVLEVKNEDSVSHQLGPIWVPPGATSRLNMEKADRFSYSCSFQSNRYLGFEVRPATTWGTRAVALFLTVPTLAVLVFLYSLALYPLKINRRKNAGV